MSNKTAQGSTNRKAGDVAAIKVRKDPTGKRKREIEVWERVAEEGTPTVLSHEWQKECCNDARTAGFIAFTHLAYILASDEQYEEMLPGLWDKYKLNKRGPKTPNVSNDRERIGVWDSLLRRWAFGTVAGIREGLDDMPYLPIYSFDKITGQLKPYDRGGMTGTAFVKLKELREYFDGCKVPLPSLLYPQPAKETASVDEFVKSLRVEVENDSQITIQEPGKSPIPYGYQRFRFKNERVKPWKLLLETLRKRPHIIKLPRTTSPGKPNTKEYDRAYKILERLNANLVKFFEEEFQKDFPKGYKIYSRYKPDGVGSFAFKFKKPIGSAINSKRFDEMSKDVLLEKLNLLAKQFREADNEDIRSRIGEQFTVACAVAKEKKYITKGEAEELLKIGR